MICLQQALPILTNEWVWFFSKNHEGWIFFFAPVHDLYSSFDTSLCLASHSEMSSSLRILSFPEIHSFSLLIGKSPCMKHSVVVDSSNTTKETPDIIWTMNFISFCEVILTHHCWFWLPPPFFFFCLGLDLSPSMFSVYFLLRWG